MRQCKSARRLIIHNISFAIFKKNGNGGTQDEEEMQEADAGKAHHTTTHLPRFAHFKQVAADRLLNLLRKR